MSTSSVVTTDKTRRNRYNRYNKSSLARQCQRKRGNPSLAQRFSRARPRRSRSRASTIWYVMCFVLTETRVVAARL
jgi:hypothetical protein